MTAQDTHTHTHTQTAWTGPAGNKPSVCVCVCVVLGEGYINNVQLEGTHAHADKLQATAES